MYRKKTWFEKDREKLDALIEEVKQLFHATVEEICQLHKRPKQLINSIQDLFGESIVDISRDPIRDSFRLHDYLSKKPNTITKKNTGRRSEHPLMIAVCDSDPTNLDHAEFAKALLDHIIGRSPKSDDFQTMIHEETNEHVLTILTRKFERSRSKKDPSGRISGAWKHMIETILEKTINPLAEIHRTNSCPRLETTDSELLSRFENGGMTHFKSPLRKPD